MSLCSVVIASVAKLAIRVIDYFVYA